MKVLLYGRFGKYPQEIENLVKSCGLEIVKENPDTVITYGGDGTILGSERDWPGIPKLCLRDSGTCYHCSSLPNDQLLKLFAEDKLQIKKYLKLETNIQNKKFIALNDIVITHQTPTSAIRFKTSLTEDKELIGDGIVVATPFGSTAYFYSISKKSFIDGLGVAFNNVINYPKREVILAKDAKISVLITRGPAVLSADNDPIVLKLNENEEITITRSAQVAQILTDAPSVPDEDRLSS